MFLGVKSYIITYLIYFPRSFSCKNLKTTLIISPKFSTLTHSLATALSTDVSYVGTLSSSIILQGARTPSVGFSPRSCSSQRPSGRRNAHHPSFSVGWIIAIGFSFTARYPTIHIVRSEERRVGKECSARGLAKH